MLPAVVFGCLLDGEMRIILLPGYGQADGGVPRDVPMAKIPFELRMPNTLLWITLDDKMNIARVWKREEQAKDT